MYYIMAQKWTIIVSWAFSWLWSSYLLKRRRKRKKRERTTNGETYKLKKLFQTHIGVLSSNAVERIYIFFSSSFNRNNFHWKFIWRENFRAETIWKDVQYGRIKCKTSPPTIQLYFPKWKNCNFITNILCRTYVSILVEKKSWMRVTKFKVLEKDKYSKANKQ